MAPSRSPYLTRFLSDFTLGFSDGLTVPFALTAGLSSLGRADTVIYAGLAEVCAGSISMGIGGYLSALDEVPAAPATCRRSDFCTAGDDDEEENGKEELRGMLRHGQHAWSGGSGRSCWGDGIEDGTGHERESGEEEHVVRSHLEPLALPERTVLDILALLRNRPGGVESVALGLRKHGGGSGDLAAAGTSVVVQKGLPTWPVVSGLSIALGYGVGGIIPLTPYLFASTVGRGLRWSIAVCLVALMAFGSGKSWVLRGGGQRGWRRSLGEGVQMLVLGSLAAGAAVLCVSLLGRSTSGDGEDAVRPAGAVRE
ncbi:hypothetical protein E4U41_002279 [Claviceps citrina]|nr:hypothetical protein E4U41_002279 [Claviceps citrina]